MLKKFTSTIECESKTNQIEHMQQKHEPWFRLVKFQIQNVKGCASHTNYLTDCYMLAEIFI